VTIFFLHIALSPNSLTLCCREQEDAVLECRGSFLCPAVQVKWIKCLQAKAEGRSVVCDTERAGVQECVAYYQSK
jgi:hypothetical protein